MGLDVGLLWTAGEVPTDKDQTVLCLSGGGFKRVRLHDSLSSAKYLHPLVTLIMHCIIRSLIVPMNDGVCHEFSRLC